MMLFVILAAFCSRGVICQRRLPRYQSLAALPNWTTNTFNISYNHPIIKSAICFTTYILLRKISMYTHYYFDTISCGGQDPRQTGLQQVGGATGKTGSNSFITRYGSSLIKDFL